mmetsp:Transcript_10101/g.20673  ORF Transcript_10101/g.20673 Transcript_10101/m.20673 type:complete len:203 (-) Transcript_10101:607-1215(-)
MLNSDVTPLDPSANAAVPGAQGFAMGLFQKLKDSTLGTTVAGFRRNVRAWATDFASPTQFNRPGDELTSRVRKNLSYFKGNYGILAGGVLVFSILTNPLLLFSLLFLSALWAYLLMFRPKLEDGSLAPLTLGSKTLSGFEQKAALGGITFVTMMITSLSSTIFWALGVSVCFIGLHASLHKTDTHEVDPEEFGAVPQDAPPV